MKIAGTIIAGGRSTRMGGDSKALMTVGRLTILERAIAALKPQTQALILNANGDPRTFEALGLTVVPDELTGIATPLAGLHASLAWALRSGYDWLVSAPSDTPFLPSDLVAKLTNAAGEGRAVIASSGGHDHYVVGVWRASLVRELQPAIVEKGTYRVKDWVNHLKAARVEWPTVPYDPFFNVNTPEDLADARRIAEEFGI